MRRIAYVCADAGVPVFGSKGSSVHVQEMIRALQRQGAHVDLFAARMDEPPPPGFDSLAIHRLPSIRDGEPTSHAAAVAALNRELAAALERVLTDRALHARLSDGARRSAERFALPAVAAAYDRVFSEVLA